MKSIIKLLRPHQWTKNIFCFAGIIFGGLLFNIDAIVSSVSIFLLFSITASAIYILNDIIDMKNDQLHPKKKHRPIASGAISVSTGAIVSSFFLMGSLISSYFIGFSVFCIIVLYVLNNILYSIKIKHVPIIDVFSIAFGFVLRLLSGIYVLGDLPTAWIVLCTFFLALFLGFSKRRAEYVSSGEWSLTEVQQRPVLKWYTKEFLDTLINDAALMSILSYALFSTTSGKNPTLIVTLPIVYFAVMHYKQIVMMHNKGEEPEIILFKDWKIWLSIIIWGLLFIVIYYFNIQIFS